MIKRYLALLFLVVLFNDAFAQDYDLMAVDSCCRVELINKDNFFALQSNDNCLFVKLWIPNCPTAEQQFKEFIDFEKSSKFPVIYIGVTNSPQKIITIANKYHYLGKLYMLDTSISTDIYKRFDIFCKDISKKLGQKNIPFSGLMLDKNKKVILMKEVIGFPIYLNNLCK